MTPPSEGSIPRSSLYSREQNELRMVWPNFDVQEQSEILAVTCGSGATRDFADRGVPLPGFVRQFEVPPPLLPGQLLPASVTPVPRDDPGSAGTSSTADVEHLLRALLSDFEARLVGRLVAEFDERLHKESSSKKSEKHRINASSPGADIANVVRAWKDKVCRDKVKDGGRSSSSSTEISPNPMDLRKSTTADPRSTAIAHYDLTVNKQDMSTVNDREKALEDDLYFTPNMDYREFDETRSNATNPLHSARSFVKKLLDTRFFEFIVLGAITANIFLIGYEADQSAAHPTAEDPASVGWMQIFQSCFNIFFSVEWALRLVGEGYYLISSSNPAATWNRIDGVLVALSWSEEVLKATIPSTPGISAMRMLRIFRFVRVMRVIRVARFFHDLRVMVWGIGSSLRSLAWALVLLFILNFMFAVMILEVVGIKLAEPLRPDPADADLREQLSATWGSMTQAIYQLYMSISGGLDWGVIVTPLAEVMPAFAGIFSLYIAMAVFCVLNIITGVFVDNTKTMLNKDETHIIMQNIEARKQWLDEVKTLWRSCSRSDDLDFETFAERIKDVRVQALFRRLGVEVAVENARGLFNLLDLTDRGTVNVDEFAMGIEMLHGTAKNIDMARLRAASACIIGELEELKFLLQGGDHENYVSDVSAAAKPETPRLSNSPMRGLASAGSATRPRRRNAVANLNIQSTKEGPSIRAAVDCGMREPSPSNRRRSSLSLLRGGLPAGLGGNLMKGASSFGSTSSGRKRVSVVPEAASPPRPSMVGPGFLS